jgi:hypothetical protein
MPDFLAASAVLHATVPEPPQAPELQISRDLVVRGLIATPLILAVSALLGGLDGVYSSAFAIGLVLVNFALAALLLARAARISLTMLMVAALGGFVLRMALVVVAIAVVRDQSWVDLPTLAMTMLVTHLGLLAWETRYVSASLAFPGLKPKGA